MKKHRYRFNKKTFTKRAITGILIVALVDMQLPFVLAFLGREQIAEDLGKVIALEIVGVFLTYCAKSFFETKSEKELEFKKEQNQTEDTDNIMAIEE